MTLPIQQPGDRYRFSHRDPDYMIGTVKSSLPYWVIRYANEDLEYEGRILSVEDGLIAELTAFVYVAHPDHDQHILFGRDDEALLLTHDQALEILSLYLNRKKSLVISAGRALSNANKEYRAAYLTHYDADLGGWHEETYNFLYGKFRDSTDLLSE